MAEEKLTGMSKIFNGTTIAGRANVAKATWIGVWLGGEVFAWLKAQYGLNYAVLHWGVAGIPIIPSVLGCVLAIFLVTQIFQRLRML